MQIRDGLHYNPYFPGGAIAMPKMLIDGAIEYEDGTPATEAQVCFPIVSAVTFYVIFSVSLLGVTYGSPPVLLQMGKDVVTFLSWAAEPEMEERKLVTLQPS